MKKRELEALTVVQLRALARERGVRLRARLKSEIVKELAKGSRAPKGTARKTAVAGKKGRAAAGAPKRADASPGGLTRRALRAQTVAGLRATAKSLGVTLRERRKEAIIGEILKQARRAAREKKQPVPSKQRAKAATGTKPGRSGKKSAAGAARGKRKVPSPTRIRPAPEGGPGRGVAQRERARGKGDTRRRSGGHHVLGSVPPSAPGRRGAPVREADSDTITAIAVEPREIFVWWQLTPEAMRAGKPSLRAYRARTGEGGEKPGAPLFQFALSSPSGSAFLTVPPGEEMFIALGVVTRGRTFARKAESTPFVTPPESYSAEEARLPDEYFSFHPLPY
jgi:hypothetical protein